VLNKLIPTLGIFKTRKYLTILFLLAYIGYLIYASAFRFPISLSQLGQSFLQTVPLVILSGAVANEKSLWARVTPWIGLAFSIAGVFLLFLFVTIEQFIT
jgi:hypothetical protein